ncbi:lipase family protein [Rhodococcus sp. NPDC058521]|uniref:lipase family protein n=1 Tax=Rhodococcus sp. NPDC058521 TaxID=3346536 RepID=UPI003666E398
MNRSIASVVVTSCAALAFAAAPGIANADDRTDLYQQPVLDLAEHADGDVVRAVPIPALPATHAELILYKSTDTNGNPMVVSGYTITPDVPWNGPGPRPVVAYAPGTSGLADRCAGSHGVGSSQDMAVITPFLAQGYQVAATDYQGLGTPGVHTYLNRQGAGNALLDVARAATTEADTPVLVYGYSEGGHASAAAAELAPSHAPELNLKGTYVGAPPADITLNIDNTDGTSLAGNLFYVLNGMIAAYPDRAESIRDIFNDEGLRILDETTNDCVSDSARFGGVQFHNVTKDGRGLREHLADEPFASIVDENTIGFTAPSKPVFISHGVPDDTVPVEQTRTLVQRWHDAGATDMTVREFDFPPIPVAGINHLPAGPAAFPELLQWMTQRLADS